MLGDTPHIFKCLRNNILKRGINTSRGGTIDKQLMREAVGVDGNSEFRLLYKVNPSTHIEVIFLLGTSYEPLIGIILFPCLALPVAILDAQDLTNTDKRILPSSRDGRDDEFDKHGIDAIA